MYPSILYKGDYHEVQSKYRFSIVSNLAYSYRIIRIYPVRWIVSDSGAIGHCSGHLHSVEPLELRQSPKHFHIID